MKIATRFLALMLAALSGWMPASGIAQTTAPAIRSFTVDQVAQLAPGTELIFRASGTPGGILNLRIDGVANAIGVPEAKPGTYEGAFTISIRDKILFDSKVDATLKVGERQTTVLLGQSLLNPQAHAAALAAAHPLPLITRVETRNSGALSGGHEVSFLVNGSAAAKASVSLDGGKTSIALLEEKPGMYSANYTVKTRDQLNDATPVLVTLALGDKKTTASKPLAVGVLLPTAVAALASKCDTCGVVESVKKVKVKGKPNYLGAIIGGVAGGAVGNQIGKGDGNTAATVIGAVGGAVAGREIEKQARTKNYYDVVVKMSDASMRTVRFEVEPAFKAGSKVKLSGDTLVANE